MSLLDNKTAPAEHLAESLYILYPEIQDFNPQQNHDRMALISRMSFIIHLQLLLQDPNHPY
ncbi:MAG: hypothetical protein ACHQII_06290, partial [Bacteroidia bacterium]